MKKRLATTLVAVLFMGSFSTQAFAEAEYLGGNSHVQLSHVMAATQPKPGSFMTGIFPLMPIMTVPKAGEVAFICQRAPRVTEAIVQYFQQNPAKLLRNQHVDILALDKDKVKVASYVNRALGKALVSEVLFSERGPKMSKGASSKLPFARLQGCSRVLQEFEDRMKKLLEGKGNAEAGAEAGAEGGGGKDGGGGK